MFEMTWEEYREKYGDTPLYEQFGVDPEDYEGYYARELDCSVRLYNTLSDGRGWNGGNDPTVGLWLKLTPNIIMSSRNVGRICTIEAIELMKAFVDTHPEKKHKSAFQFGDESYDILTPAGRINVMFAQTDLDGTLVLPIWPYDDSDDTGNEKLVVKMAWDEEGKEELKEECEKLCKSLKSIAEVYKKLGTTEEYNRKLLSEEDFKVWKTYIRAFDTGDVDADEVFDVMEGIEAGTVVRCEEDEELCARYAEAVYADSESRLDRPLAAYDVVIRAKRLCRLLSLHAPTKVEKNEETLLVQAMAVNRFGLSMEKTDAAD